MNILVTGGAGNVGKGVVAHLVQQGHAVHVVDRKIDSKQAGVSYAACDITDYDAVREQVRDMQGIVHLAAYPYPGAARGPELFRVNATGTYNVFEAAAAEGIQRVTCASSINAFGYNYGIKEFPIQYFPLDEGHPPFTTDPYSFSKGITEEIAAYYWRRDGIASTCLRMPWVYSLEQSWMAEMSNEFSRKLEPAMRAFTALPEDQQRQRFLAYKADLNQQRAQRLFEKPYDFSNENDEGHFSEDQMIFFGFTDFWAVISVEDTAIAFEQSLLASFEGSHPLYITERENSNGMDSETLLRLCFPEVTQRTRPIPGNSNILSYERARQLIGFEPRYLLRERFGRG